MNKLKQIWGNLRGSVWFLPSLIVAGSVAAAAALIQVDAAGTPEWISRWPRLFGASAAGARGVLSTIVGSMMTVTFSMVLVTLALASSPYTSRILRNFMRDRVTQVVRAIFASRAWLVPLFVLLATSAARAQPPDEVPDAAVSMEVVAADESAAEVARIRAALDAVGGFDDTQVDEQAGVVRLRGSVHAPAARRIAEQIAVEVAHPIYVANGIVVLEPTPETTADDLTSDDIDQALAGQLRTILGTVDELAAVQVEVRSGIVHLTGVASGTEARDRAVEVAGGLDGVLYVDDNMRVETGLGEQIWRSWTNLRHRGTELLGELPRFGVGLIVFFLALLVARTISGWTLVGRAFSRHALLQSVARRLLGTLTLIAGAVLALDVMQATAVVGALLGTAGIVGLALGFAFKDIVENYLAGILLALSRPFAPEDHVKVGDIEGKVLRLSPRETILMTLDGNHVQIPNATVFGQPVLNFTRNPLRRFDFEVGIGNGEDLLSAQRLVVEALEAMQGVMTDPAPFTRLDGFDDSSMTVHVYGWVDQRQCDFGKVKSEAIRQVKRTLDEHEVDLPNPITQVWVEQAPPRAPKSKTIEARAPANDLSVDRVIEEQIHDQKNAGVDLLEVDDAPVGEPARPKKRSPDIGG